MVDKLIKEIDETLTYELPSNLLGIIWKGKYRGQKARGLSSFTSDEISKIKGQHSNKINDLLGYISKSEVVHKDDMVEI